MNAFDYVVLLGTILGIAAYGIWHTRQRRDLQSYLKGDRNTRWWVIGISVMATQASAVTFLSTPGQGYQDGMKFIQNYFGAPFALIVICAVFLPIYRRLDVYTAYEFLGRRFDARTRLLAAALFLLQRALAAGVTIYAPAIVLSTVFGWPLYATIVLSGSVVTVYTVSGGCDAVNITQKYQFAVIIIGMVTALGILLARLPPGLSVREALEIAGGFHKLKAVDFSVSLHERYTFWSGLLGGMFLALSYFGADQSQVQRYIAGSSLRASRFGLMFNAVFKIPMQFLILLLGALLFVFYQFERQPVFFNQASWNHLLEHGSPRQADALYAELTAAQTRERASLEAWLAAKRAGDRAAQDQALAAARSAQARGQAVRDEAQKILATARQPISSQEADYVFIRFILDYLPHGLIGLLVTVFFAATLSSKAGELNALGSATTVDFYRHVFNRSASDQHYVLATKWFTALWGAVAVAVALSIQMAENLIQAQNIIASLLYGVLLGMFCVAFFLKRVGGTAVFFGALAAQIAVFILFFSTGIGYLWFNFIGCAACVGFSLFIQAMLGPRTGDRREAGSA